MPNGLPEFTMLNLLKSKRLFLLPVGLAILVAIGILAS
jgi:hypothetical protein